MTQPFQQQPPQQPGPYPYQPQQPYGAYPPPHQPYGAPYPPPRPPKKKTPPVPLLILVGVLALCGFGGCVSAIGGSNDDAASKTTTSRVAPGEQAKAAPPVAAPTEQAPPKPDHAPAGSAVRDGKFEFVVTQIEQGLKVVGTNPYLQKEAQGQYILVHTTVTNIGDRPRAYFGSNQTLIDAQGREFTNDTMAEVNVNDSAVIGADINPGNQLSVVIAFDVPVDAQPTVIEFHDSAFSGGAKVALQ
ncbi:DUF4352 domain-containing protein [Nocardia sp. NPDC002869]|uniref:DUF4352 domain-containing protein n=1 Tax=Nocardia sp. NPDC002869 TaxID=3161032 RepID=UPI00398D408D